MNSKLLLGVGIFIALLSSCKHKEKVEALSPIRVETLSVTETHV